MLRSLSILVENRTGVLNRITNLIARRGFNIESIAAGTTQDPTVTRITLMLLCNEERLQQVIRQLLKLPDILMVRDLTPIDHFSRELAFIKVRSDEQARMNILQVVNIFRGHVIDVSPTTMTIEISGREDKIKAIQEMLIPYGILEIVRTGPIAIERGDRFMNVST